MFFGELPGGLLSKSLCTTVDVEGVAIRCKHVLARGVSPVYEDRTSARMYNVRGLWLRRYRPFSVNVTPANVAASEASMRCDERLQW